MAHPTIPLQFQRFQEAEMQARAEAFRSDIARRRTVRDFSAEAVPRALIETCLAAAGSAPSGANQQPWRFVAVSDAAVKKHIREAAEAEEREFYARRATDAWRAALAPLGTDAEKPFLETAPWLIAVFYEAYALDAQGNRDKRYYPMDSVGIASGFLIAALHHAGLATLTHTPSPMAFLNTILGRPDNERPFLLLVVGYPAADARVPAISRKSLSEIAVFV
ncbi:MAG: nitroreductase family protein [Betaproteobacteria bacterium]|nr:nitroreductase family protein [Betaproteobacteria bacterium]